MKTICAHALDYFVYWFLSYTPACSYPDGPITARYRFIKNAYRDYAIASLYNINKNT